MRRTNFYMIMAFLFLVLGVSRNSPAQEATLSNPDWQATVEKIKLKTKALLTENEKLNSEYEFLQGRVAGLKADIERIKSEIKELNAKKKVSGAKAPNQPDGEAIAKMADLQKQIDDINSENKELEKQLAEVQEKNRLWKVQLSEVESQKRDVNLDVQYQKAQGENAAKNPASQLQAELEKTLKKEKELSEALTRMNTEGGNSMMDSGNLKKNNRDLEDHIKLVKKQIAEQKKQNEKMRKAGSKLKPKPPANISALEKQKRSLEDEVAKLSRQIDAVSKTVGESQEALENKRRIMDRIMRLDSDNQELRAKIDALVSPIPEK